MSKKPMIPPCANATAGLRHVFVRDLEVMATLGIYEVEKLAPAAHHRQHRSVGARRQGRGCDDISHVVSYEIVVKKVEAIIAQGHVNLVETLCELIAASCLKDKRVVAARVRIEKPDIIPNARSVGIEIERVRP